MPGEFWSSDWYSSLLFLGVGQFERHLANQLQELRILPLQLDDLGECRLTFRLLGDPAIDGVLGNAMVFGGVNDRDAVVLDAIDNLLLHVLGDAVLLHMLVC